MCLRNALFVFPDLVVTLAKLFLQGADLFAHVIFFLVARNAFAHAAVNHGVAFQNLRFVIQHHANGFNTDHGIKAFQHGLLVLGAQQHVGSNHICQHAGIPECACGVHDLLARCGQVVHYALHSGQRSAHKRLGANAAVILERVGFAHDLGVRAVLGGVQSGQHAAGHTHGYSTVLSVTGLDKLSDFGNRANAVQLLK